MIELGFGVEDLARTSFGVSPMDHLLMGSVAAGRHYMGASPRRARWWRGVRSQVPAKARPFLELVNGSSLGMPDFLAADIFDPRRRFTDELDAIAAVGDDQIRAETALCYPDDPRTPYPPVVRRLYDEGRTALRQVVDGAHALYRACLAPDWRDLQRTLETDVAGRAHRQADHGPAEMFHGIHPRLTWNAQGLLSYDEPEWVDESEPLRYDLGGQGLQLRPNLFADAVGFLLREGRPPVLIHPAGAAATPPRRAGAADGLVVLLGPSRSHALRAIGTAACSTTELAAVLGITPPSASALATALRTGGLITTTRRGRQVQHLLTPLGDALLTANPPPPGPR